MLGSGGAIRQGGKRIGGVGNDFGRLSDVITAATVTVAQTAEVCDVGDRSRQWQVNLGGQDLRHTANIACGTDYEYPAYRRSSAFDWALRSIGGIGLLAFFGIPAAADAIPSEVIGEYSGLPCPKGDASCFPTRPSDRLRVFRAPNGAVRVSVRITFERGQRCQIDTELTFSDKLLQARAEGLEEKAMCELNLHQQGSTLIIEDVGLLCREVYCGTGGTFSGARFKRR